jgi:uncharacterized protein
MTEHDSSVSRRGFIKGASLAGIGGVLGLGGAAFAAAEIEKQAKEAATTGAAVSVPAGAKIPTRKFGKTGVDVSMLSMGGMYPIPNNQIMLKKALDWGLTYWDTADCYEGGKSEEGIGMYFEKFPEDRKKVFLVTKSDKRDVAGMSELLARSLDRMKTDHIDLYFIHGMSKISELNDETKAWAEKMKKEGKIRFFGFSTHSNMEDLLLEASKMGWIDGIMLTYNVHKMVEDKMKKAIEACVKAGIGLTAMKTQGGGPVKTDNEAEVKLAGPFLDKGLTPQQVKLLAVWQNPVIASICSQMPNLTIMSANVAAAVGDKKLTAADWSLLRSYASATASSYCAGCSSICESAVGGACRIQDVMRYMMYRNGYGETHDAREKFAKLPADMRAAMAGMDFSSAEKACPRNLPIGDIMREATRVLA